MEINKAKCTGINDSTVQLKNIEIQ